MKEILPPPVEKLEEEWREHVRSNDEALFAAIAILADMALSNIEVGE